MKRNKKIIIGLIIFFVILVTITVAFGNYYKFSETLKIAIIESIAGLICVLIPIIIDLLKLSTSNESHRETIIHVSGNKRKVGNIIGGNKIIKGEKKRNASTKVEIILNGDDGECKDIIGGDYVGDDKRN